MLISDEPVLSSHLPVPRGWPLNRGSTVSIFSYIFLVLINITVYLEDVYSLFSFSFQQLASLSLVELCKTSSGREGCATASPAEISVLLHSLESPAASLRFATLQGFLVLTDLLSTGDHGTAQTAQLVRRLWVAKFDVDEENAKLGEKYEKQKYV